MKITLDEIKKLERLSALSSSDEKLKSLVKDFEQIADFVEQVKNVDIDKLNSYNRVLSIDELREDKVVPSTDRASLLMNAPDKNDEAYIVPRVVE